MKKEISLEKTADLIERALTETGKTDTAFTIGDLKLIRKVIEIALNEEK